MSEQNWQQLITLQEQSATPGHPNQRQAAIDYRHALMGNEHVLAEREWELRRGPVPKS